MSNYFAQHVCSQFNVWHVNTSYIPFQDPNLLPLAKSSIIFDSVKVSGGKDEAKRIEYLVCAVHTFSSIALYLTNNSVCLTFYGSDRSYIKDYEHLPKRKISELA